MDRIKTIQGSQMSFDRRKRNWWENDEDSFDNKWMTGPKPGNANTLESLSILGQTKTNKDAILISQQNAINSYSGRSTGPTARKRTGYADLYPAKGKQEMTSEQYTFAFIADTHIDTEA